MSVLERKLISSLLFTQDGEQREELFKGYLKSGLNPDLFLDGKVKKVIETLKEHYKNYNKVPTIDVLQGYFRYDDNEWVRFFTDIRGIEKELRDSGETYSFLLKSVQGEILNKKSEDSIRKALDFLDKKDFDEYSKVLKCNLQEITNISYTKERLKISNRSELEERKKEYLLKSSEKKKGIMCGIDEIDSKAGGWFKQDLVVICGRPGNRKTFLTLKMLSNMLKQGRGYKILVVSMEMRINALRDRLEALHFDLPYTELSRGELANSLKEEYFKNLDRWDRDNTEGEVFFVDWVKDTIDLVSAIDDYTPDIVVIDGAYLMKEYTAKVMWEKASNIARDIKSIAKRMNVLTLVTWQCNRDSENKEGSLSGLAYSDSVGHESDGVIQISEIVKNKEYRIESLKVREGEEFKFKVKFDVNSCEFRVIEDSSEEESGDQQESVQESMFEEDDDLAFIDSFE